jgi:hypothetical protein
MTTFALIDIHSGYFWGIANADTAAQACRIVDENLGENAEVYTETGRHEDDASYDVYDATAIESDLVDSNGQDEDVIALIEAQPFVTRIART